MIVLDPELRFRNDGVCYHPRIGYFTVNDTWVRYMDLWDSTQIEPYQDFDSPTSIIISEKLINLGLAKNSNRSINSHRKRPLPNLPDKIIAPIDAEIYPTYECNHSCNFCSSGERSMNNGYQISLLPNYISELSKRLSDVGIFNVGIVGGEPFLYPHLDMLINELLSTGIHVHITTNGSISPKKLFSLFHEGLHIAVSLHGDEREHDMITGRKGSYSKAVNTIKSLVAENLSIRIISVIEKPSVEKVKYLSKDWSKLGVSNITFCRLIRTGRANGWNMDPWDAESIVKLENSVPENMNGCQIRVNTGLRFRLGEPAEIQEAPFYFRSRIRCDAGIRGIYIGPQGDLYPCDLLAKESYKLGNIMHDDWFNNIVKSSIISMLRGLNCPETCNSCEYCHVCLGGCPALQGSGSLHLNKPTLHCPFD